MLTQEDDVEIQALASRGWSISAIARHTGRDRKGDAFVRRQQKAGKQPQEVFGELADAVLVPSVERERAAIAGLQPPAGDRQQIDAILAAQQAGIEAVRELGDVVTPADLERPFDQANERFRAYGLPTCVM